MKSIYLAGPYSHKSARVRNQREKTLGRVAATLVLQGYCVFSPITHSAPLVRLNKELDGSYKVWKDTDHQFIQILDEIMLVALPGVTNSVGVKDEMEFAVEIGKPVHIILADESGRYYHHTSVYPREHTAEEAMDLIFGTLNIIEKYKVFLTNKKRSK